MQNERETELTNLLHKAIENLSNENLTISTLFGLINNFQQKQGWLWEVIQEAKKGKF